MLYNHPKQLLYTTNSFIGEERVWSFLFSSKGAPQGVSSLSILWVLCFQGYTTGLKESWHWDIYCCVRRSHTPAALCACLSCHAPAFQDSGWEGLVTCHAPPALLLLLLLLNMYLTRQTRFNTVTPWIDHTLTWECVFMLYDGTLRWFFKVISMGFQRTWC